MYWKMKITTTVMMVPRKWVDAEKDGLRWKMDISIWNFGTTNECDKFVFQKVTLRYRKWKRDGIHGKWKVYIWNKNKCFRGEFRDRSMKTNFYLNNEPVTTLRHGMPINHHFCDKL